MCGLRVKITYTFSVSGTMAPVFISVLRLTERELPKEPIVLINIKGLCIGGRVVNVGEQQYVIFIFMRGDNKMDKKIYQIYRDKIIIPFIAHTRAEYGEWRVGMIITEELKAVIYCDKDLDQIDNIINYTSLKLTKKIT